MKSYSTLALLLLLLTACSGAGETDDTPAYQGLVEVRPSLPSVFSTLAPDRSGRTSAATRVYDDAATTDGKLTTKVKLPDGSTVWLVAKDDAGGGFSMKSYVVYNGDGETESYLYPCTVDDEGNMKSMSATPMYLEIGRTYSFSAISPARKFDEAQLAEGRLAFTVSNGDYVYANDGRYPKARPVSFLVEPSREQVQVIELNPIMNQTAQLKFQITRDASVHSLEMLSSGVEISGLQGYADGSDGAAWHMSQVDGDEPITLQHGEKTSSYTEHRYTTDADGNFIITAGVIPMYSISKPLIVLFNLKVNGIPTTYEMMLNEKDLKAGYSYGYRGTVKIEGGVSVMTWQTVSWETDVEIP